MAIAQGTRKSVIYKKETGGWGTLAGASGGKQLRRVTANFELTKEAYESAELRVDHQVASYSHGIRSATGTLNGELSAGSYADFMQSILERDFTAVTIPAAVSVTVTVSGSTNKIIRSTGSWITDGLSVGEVVRGTGFTATADNNKNLLILAVTATELTVRPLNGVLMTAQATAASATLTAPGKQTYVPATGHTNDSFTVEEWFSDIQQSEVYTGLKVNSMAVSLPSTGLTTIDFGFAGRDLAQKGSTQYFTSPAAQNTNGIFAAVNGAMVVNGAPVALITSADFTVDRATENATAVGSNSVAEIFTGRVRVTGNLSIYFQDATFRDYFDNETPVSLVMALTADNTANSSFISFVLPKVKLGSFSKQDAELGLTASSSFTALLNDVTTAGLLPTTIAIQDSTLV